jgi:predicted Na+-dependent transporter
MVTGFMTGWFMVLLLFPLANNSMFKRFARKNYLDSRKKFLTWLAAGIVGAILFIFTNQFAFIFWSTLSVLGLIAFITLILFIIFFSLNRRLLGSIDSWKKYLAAIVIGMVSSAALLILFSYLRRFLI